MLWRIKVYSITVILALQSQLLIPRDNSAGHCFVFRDLRPINLFKKAVIMKLKICTTGEILDKIYLKAIRDTFFPICVLRPSGDGESHKVILEDSVFWHSVTSKKRGSFKILSMRGTALSHSSPLIWKSLFPQKKTLWGVCLVCLL